MTQSEKPTKTSPPPLPMWWVERLLVPVAGVTGALGAGLDRVSAGRNPLAWLIRRFSSVWLGILWLLLMAVYIAIGSGLADLRARLEMTEMQFFNAWPMVVLTLLLIVNLTIVTLRRIPLNIFKLGVWVVHIGIVIMVLGCFVYFSQKMEGSVRVFLKQSVAHYFDAYERALYVQRVDAQNQPVGAQAMIPLPGLPIFHEHGPAYSRPLNIKIPGTVLAQADAQLAPVQLDIVGYYPFAQPQMAWRPQAGTDGTRGVEFALSIPGQAESRRWLVEANAVRRVIDSTEAPFGIEFIARNDPQRLELLQAPGKGPWQVRVCVKSTHQAQWLNLASPERVFRVGAYEITVGDEMTMPMLSKGYEGTQSAALNMTIKRQNPDGTALAFERLAVSRFPELSPDFIMENGQRKRVQARVDQDLEIVVLDNRRDQFYIVDNGAGYALLQRPAGGAERIMPQPLRVGQGVPVQVQGVTLQLALQQISDNMVQVASPLIMPPTQRPVRTTPQDIMGTSMIEVDVHSGPGDPQRVLVQWAQFAGTKPPLANPAAVVTLPGGQRLQLVLSTTRYPLPVRVTLEGFAAIKHRNADHSYADYRSDLRLEDLRNGQTLTSSTQLNQPTIYAGLSFFQAAWDGDDKALPEARFSVLGVGNRPGIVPMTLGAIMMMLGVAYAFYVKPILLLRRKAELARHAALRSESGA